MKRRLLFFLAAALLTPGAVLAQTTPFEGMRENPSGVHALTNARIVVEPGRILERGTVVIRDGAIQAVGANVTPPADAFVWDLSGHTLYPGFIDAHSKVGLSNARDLEGRGARHWNPQVRSHLSAADEFSAGAEELQLLRSQGFTLAHAVPADGVFRGVTALVSLGGRENADRVLRAEVAQSVSFTRNVGLGATYPTSEMGGIALIRQVLYDAEWYPRAHETYRRNPAGLRRPEANAALERLAPAAVGRLPLVFETTREEEVLRALALAEEFPITPWIRGSGDDYLVMDALRGSSIPLILPLNYPQRPNVSTPEAALNVSLGDLRRWYLAPENPGRLAAAGVEFALTTDGLGNNRSDFIRNLRLAVNAGLSEDVALAALTTRPARLLGVQATHGTLESGKVANLVVVEGDLFREDGRIRDVWVDGRRYEVEAAPSSDPRGRWVVMAPDAPALEASLEVGGAPGRPSGTIILNGETVRATTVQFQEGARRLRVDFPGSALGMEGTVRVSATISGNTLSGWGDLPDGSRVALRGERSSTLPQTAGGNGENGDAPTAARARMALEAVWPAMEYGRASIPEQPAAVLVRNATVWTMGPQGVMENADLLIRRGEVAEVGQNLQAPSNAVVIDGTGKHVTPGLIDAHLHSGLSGGVNETGAAIVPEVRIGDVLTTNNIWMYRQLAGGLTAAHVMHGSANPIGGQNQHVKMRWGASVDDIRMEGAPRTVKFALGENPTRRPERYPDTRQGVNELIAEHFRAAREYEAGWAEWERTRQGIPPRRDLRMDALVDILNEDILVQSHSYRQDEILALMRLAEEFDFTIKAFHHGVEAYKVAPELREHGAGAVVWTDWSSFKIEAYDASVYNARLLVELGVLTSLHSDNSQLAARMNWEAGKMVRAGMDEVDAMALITINTAKLIGVDDRIGSLESGKDGDFVIWSGHPLSTFTRAEQTWVDGRRYFDLEEDRVLRARAADERARLIQAALNDR